MRLTGVGVGPGDPGLVTMAALEEIRAAGAVFAPALAAGSPGRAEAVVAKLAPAVTCHRVVFPMGRGVTGIEARRQAAAEAAEQMAAIMTEGGRYAFVTLGDPTLYSTFSLVAEFAQACLPGLEIAVIPGIMAFQRLLALSTTNFVDNDEPLHLVLGIGRDRDLEQALGNRRAGVVIYKVGSALLRIKELARNYGRSAEATAGWLLGTGEEVVVPLLEAPDEVPYLATVVIRPSREPG